MEITDEQLWERELGEHLQQHSDFDSLVAAPSSAGVDEPAATHDHGVFWAQPAFLSVVLWTLLVALVCTVGWLIGWFVV